MADTFNLYKDSKKIGNSASPVKVTGLAPNIEVAEGTYQVSRVTDDGESEKIAIPAFKTKPIAVTGVMLDKTTISGKPGDKGKLTPTITPTTASNKAFTFSSSAADIIKIDNAGNWEMLKDGTADLTVKTTDGGKTAVCKGTVTTPVVHPTGVTASPKTHSAEAGTAGSYTIAAAVAPSNANNKAVGYTIAPTTAGLTVSAAGKVDWTADVPAGTYTTTVKTTDGGKTDTSVLTIDPKPTEPPAEG